MTQGFLRLAPVAMLVVAQLYGIVVTLAWSGALTFVILKVIGALMPLRVRREDEVMGLDVSLHGEAIP